VSNSVARRPLLRVVPNATDNSRPLTDDELLAGLARADPEVSAELCKRLLRTVDATLYRVLGGRDVDHEDLVQTTFEQIVKTLSRGKFGHECSLSTWAAAIACNVALQAIRRRRNERRIFDASLGLEQLESRPGSGADAESQVASRRELARVRFHLSQMSEKLSRALLLCDVAGCSQAEVAEILEISVAAAQARVVRGRQELTERLARDASRSTRGGGS